ncbi:MAG: hypothetical protein IPK82_31345 [Polyangiaceae bacterium]|nr:hypothetical protein [Polyangiaceae bacterium]
MNFQLWCGAIGAALAALLASGCGGGACGDYCSGAAKCFGEISCELSDPGAYEGYCNDGCNAGLDALNAEESAAIQKCLGCVGKAFQDSCGDTTDAFAKCQVECGDPALQTGIPKWGEAAEKAADDVELTCTNGKPAGGLSCSTEGGSAEDGGYCIISCSGGNTSLTVNCTEPTTGDPSCTCDGGKNDGKTFVATCNAIFEDDNLMWDECNL